MKETLGVVVSSKMDKTIIVKVTRRVPHPVYRKIVKKFKKYYVHDEKKQAQLGDTVLFVETRPMSKLKRWKLKEVVR